MVLFFSSLVYSVTVVSYITNKLKLFIYNPSQLIFVSALIHYIIPSFTTEVLHLATYVQLF